MKQKLVNAFTWMCAASLTLLGLVGAVTIVAFLALKVMRAL